MKSSEQLRRMVQLIPFLVANPGVSVDHTAEVFATTPATILADLSVIQFVGLPGGYADDLIDIDLDYVRASGEIYISNAEVLATPMTLTQDQATSLSVALMGLVELGDQAAGTALAKITAACGGAGEQVSVELASGDAEVRRTLMTACEQRRQVRIQHLTRNGLNEVIVEPARLRTDAGQLYLDGWSHQRQAWRSFHVGRISAVELLNEPVHEREGLEEATQRWFAQTADHLEITVSQEGQWISEYYPTTEVSLAGDQHRVSLPISSPEWGAALLLRLGPAVLEVAQSRIAELAAAQAAQALVAYSAK